MLYLNFIQNREEFILEKENNFPYFIKRILYLIRKISGQPLIETIDGKTIVSISKFNGKIAKKIDKIFKIDVTKNVCVCDSLKENSEIMSFLESENINIMNGRWLFRYLIPDIAKFICDKIDLLPEERRNIIISK